MPLRVSSPISRGRFSCKMRGTFCMLPVTPSSTATAWLSGWMALSRDSLAPLAVGLPGAHIVDGGFQHTGIAIAVPKNRPQALAYVTAFVEDAKVSGVVRRALDDAGFKDEPVAPPRAVPT